jgi:AcrR family transcriptional regulator
MARSKLTEEQIAEFKSQLVTAATRLFVNDGYAGVTMRAIAKELNCSPMKAYRYFGDKDEVFAVVRTAAFQSFAETQKNAYFSEENSVDRLSALGAAYFLYASENPLQYRLMFELLQSDPAGHPELEEARIAAMKPLRVAISELVEQGTFENDVDLLTNVFWAGVHGTVSLSLAGKLLNNTDAELLGHTLTTALFAGLATKAK